MNLQLVIALLTTLFALHFPLVAAYADDDDDADATSDQSPSDDERIRRSLRVSSRGIASSGNYVISRGEGAGSFDPKFYDVRLGALIGASSMAATDRDPSLTNLTLNATVDVRLWKYVGIEADVTGDALKPSYFADPSNATAAGTSRAIRGYFGNVKAQYPFWIGDVKVIPKAGAGYGSYSETFIAGGSATATERSTTVQGLYATGGVDVEATRRLIFYGDYARSLGATGERDGQALTTINYDRFRLGGYYRMAPNWGLGAQFVHRQTSFDSLTSNTEQDGFGQNQFFGMVMFQF